MDGDFGALVQRATGHGPYPYQTRLAAEGLPELLRVPTGCGKTLAAVLPWIYRRRFHGEASVRTGTPHWLVFTLPMRTLVEQVHEVIGGWLARLDLRDSVGLHRVVGGESRSDAAWREQPDGDAIFVGTLDMLVSRALNRGYGESRFAWPIDFGLFNSGCQWVFDEVQLMGPALPTSRQLEGLRRSIGTAVGSGSMWMSATVDDAVLRTVDLPEVASEVEISEADRAGGLAARLDAAKTVHEVPAASSRYEADLAEALVTAHSPGTLTIAVCNTVARARALYARVLKAVGGSGPQVVLLHSRFRPGERRQHASAALASVDPESEGRIVIATQVIEAGVDVSASVLLTEAAPWPSIIQRAGRCNRDGLDGSARLLWVEPPKALPYEAGDIDASITALRDLEAQRVSPSSLGALAVATTAVVHPVLRRRDLVGLFDTTPDLAGNDLDVSRFIRTGDDIDVHVAWREAAPEGASEGPTRDELCPVPVGEVRKFLGAGKQEEAWIFDHLAGVWQRARPEDVRPGRTIVLAASGGGYQPDVGWDPASKRAVAPVRQEPPNSLTVADEAVDADPVSYTERRWVALATHLGDVEREARELAARFSIDGLASVHLEAASVAGRLHDVGKAHPEFQQTLLRSCGDDDQERSDREAGLPWAKSGGSQRSRHARRYLRHELASLLMLLGDGASVLAGVAEPDLVRYLIAAHHGRVRLAIRALPDEEPHPDGGRVALGIRDGDRISAVSLPAGEMPACVLDLSPMELGCSASGEPSWTTRALALRDRDDLGIFRLGFLEALVRLADWRVSAAYDRSVP